jgi:hypothetical protein
MGGWGRVVVCFWGMAGDLGVVFTQPDMFDHRRIGDEDFPLKAGHSIILLEFRVQQSPKTRVYERQQGRLMVGSISV